MGWTSRPVSWGESVNAQGRQKFLLHEMEFGPDSKVRMVDHSGLISMSRVWALYETCDDNGVADNRFVAVGRIKIWKNEVAWRIDDESVGPDFYDCPQRLLRAAMEFEPVSDYSREWRQAALDYHKQHRARERLLRQIEKEPYGGDKRMVVGSKPCRLVQIRTRGGRTRRTYQPLGTHVLYLLSVDRINVEASEALRAMPRTTPDAL